MESTDIFWNSIPNKLRSAVGERAKEDKKGVILQIFEHFGRPVRPVLTPCHTKLSIAKYAWRNPAPVADHFVFVSTARFAEPIRPSVVLVKDAKVFSRTSAIRGVKRQNLSIAGGASQRLMVNEGPGVDQIHKATGKTMRVTPINEVLQRNLSHSGPKPAGIESKPGHHDSPANWGSDQSHGNRDDGGRDHDSQGSSGHRRWPDPGTGRDDPGGGHGKVRG